MKAKILRPWIIPTVLGGLILLTAQANPLYCLQGRDAVSEKGIEVLEGYIGGALK